MSSAGAPQPTIASSDGAVWLTRVVISSVSSSISTVNNRNSTSNNRK